MEGKPIYLVRHPVADLYLGERGWALPENARIFFQKDHAQRHAFVNDGFVVEARFVFNGAAEPSRPPAPGRDTACEQRVPGVLLMARPSVQSQPLVA